MWNPARDYILKQRVSSSQLSFDYSYIEPSSVPLTISVTLSANATDLNKSISTDIRVV